MSSKDKPKQDPVNLPNPAPGVSQGLAALQEIQRGPAAALAYGSLDDNDDVARQLKQDLERINGGRPIDEIFRNTFRALLWILLFAGGLNDWSATFSPGDRWADIPVNVTTDRAPSTVDDGRPRNQMETPPTLISESKNNKAMKARTIGRNNEESNSDKEITVNPHIYNSDKRIDCSLKSTKLRNNNWIGRGADMLPGYVPRYLSAMEIDEGYDAGGVYDLNIFGYGDGYPVNDTLFVNSSNLSIIITQKRMDSHGILDVNSKINYYNQANNVGLEFAKVAPHNDSGIQSDPGSAKRRWCKLIFSKKMYELKTGAAADDFVRQWP
jgi:hypothetical protein